ncbi:hypothetical protein PG988_000741 [Apiospora saccharicola]
MAIEHQSLEKNVAYCIEQAARALAAATHAGCGTRCEPDRNTWRVPRSEDTRLPSISHLRAASPWRPPDAGPRRGHGGQLDKHPFTRAELDKLFGDYDCLIESPCYLGASGIRTYVDDPNVKFILTQRSPASFAKSLAGSLGCYYAKLHEWPLTAARVCDGFVWELERMFRLMTFRWSHGLHPSDPGFRQALEQSYVEYMELLPSLVPAERVLVLDLDKGFGWEEICDFLDCEVPEEPYPRSNSMVEFHVAAEMVLAPAVWKTMMILATSAAAVVGIGAFYLQRMRR